jgi:hypothetical protein
VRRLQNGVRLAHSAFIAKLLHAMALHILKLCVGVDDIDQLHSLQRRRLKEQGAVRHFTRHRPRRADEITAGGSIYWIIRGHIQVRQRILAIEDAANPDGKRCALVLESSLIPTEPQPRRPHQGWRYLESRDAPADLVRGTSDDALPAPLVQKLKEIGAW